MGVRPISVLFLFIVFGAELHVLILGRNVLTPTEIKAMAEPAGIKKRPSRLRKGGKPQARVSCSTVRAVGIA